jgi:hypothetical protein
VFQWAAAVVQSAVALSEMSSYAELSIAAKIQAATAAVSSFAGVNKVVCCCQWSWFCCLLNRLLQMSHPTIAIYENIKRLAELSIAALRQAAVAAASAFAVVTKADAVVFLTYCYKCLILHLQFIKTLNITQN